MSLLQDYEEARRKIGAKKYDTIDIYIEELCPTEKRNLYKQELKKIHHLEINEWEKEKKKLEKEYGIVYLDDILYNEIGWEKFEKWYQEYEKKMEQSKIINGYKIYKGGTWCEVTKNGTHIFSGVVDEKMTIEQIYQEVLKEVVFSIKGKEVLSYDSLNEFKGERDSTIKQLADDNNCDIKDIEVTIRKPELKKKILEIRFIGIDSWDRPVYKSRDGKIFKDINLGKGYMALYTAANNDFYGEPDAPINDNFKVKVVKSFKKDKTRESSR